jgi:hypothetical protein
METDELQQDGSENTTQEVAQTEAQAEQTQEAQPDWKAEAAKWKAIAERNKNKAEKKAEPAAPTPEVKGDLSVNDFLALRKEKFSDEEIALVAEEASKLGVPVTKVLSNSTFKAGIEALREKAKIEQATPNPSSRSTTVSNKSFSALPKEQQKASYEQTIKSLVDKARQ